MDKYMWIFTAGGLFLTLLNILLSRAVAIGSFKQQYKQLLQDVEELKISFSTLQQNTNATVKEAADAIRAYLFVGSGDNIGRTIYMPRVDCKEETEECKNRMCREFKRMEVKMDLMDSKRTEAKKETNAKLDEIYDLLMKHLISNGEKVM